MWSHFLSINYACNTIFVHKLLVISCQKRIIQVILRWITGIFLLNNISWKWFTICYSEPIFGLREKRLIIFILILRHLNLLLRSIITFISIFHLLVRVVWLSMPFFEIVSNLSIRFLNLVLSFSITLNQRFTVKRGSLTALFARFLGIIYVLLNLDWNFLRLLLFFINNDPFFIFPLWFHFRFRFIVLSQNHIIFGRCLILILLLITLFSLIENSFEPPKHV